MVAIETIHLPERPEPWRLPGLWPAVAGEAAAWLRRRGAAPRDAVLLLPFAALLAPARAALAAAGGWQPRVETALTLAASLAPPPELPPGAACGEPVADRMAAAALLRRQAWGADWERRDAAGFARIVGLVADAAGSLREAALARPPEAREAFWQAARDAAGAAGGPAAFEGSLLRLAIEWAAAGAPAATDRLFALRPSAWIAVQIGGPDALAEGLLGHAGVPSLRIVTDPAPDEPWSPVAAHAAVERLRCDDAEAEAQAAAAEVVAALNEGRAPVALVALDRSLLRRVRALLERLAVPLLDETGWVLATTPAAAAVASVLRAALPEAGADARLDWLKTWPPAAAEALDALEADWRGRRHVPQRELGERLWREAQDHLAALQEPGLRPLAGWLDALQELLARDGGFERLQDDAAGAQALAALGFSGMPRWRAAAAEWRLDLPGFLGWVESTLEAAPFLPLPDEGAQVVLTPLARAFGRPFGHVVVPGADAAHLGAGEGAPSLIGRPMAEALGLDHAQARLLRQRLALSQILRAPRVTLLRRRRDGDEPLADSPDVEWLQLARAAAGAPRWPERDARPLLAEVPAAPVVPPQPEAADALPAVISASQLERLRECPYRFFARAVLRLDEPDELDTELAKREYGDWLHATLHHFHSTRDPKADDATQLHDAADGAALSLGLDAAALLPFRASFACFVPAYLAWLAKREAAGWFWSDGESEHRATPAAWPGVTLRGRIDRLDHGPEGARQLLDYKTGSRASLARKVKAPLEDTQLAFYAALLGADAAFGAAYLALDDDDSPKEVPHPQVHETAAEMLLNLGAEWQRLRGGEPLRALGEAPLCEHCEARGLCRRDHWSTGP